MKVDKIRRKLIKPHTPTPQNLKNYKISFLDKCLWPMNIGVVLFYESKPNDECMQLEESLAKTLVQFYPLAGRYIKNHLMVDCNDQGAEFVEAEAYLNDDVELTDLELKDLVPDQYFRLDEAASHPLLSIQITHLLPSRGVAIAISASHRVFDGASFGTFIAAWSNAATINNLDDKMAEFKFIPSFDLPSLLPYKHHDFGVKTNRNSSSEVVNDNKFAVKRLLFNGAALTSLKTKIRPNNNGKTVSRVRVVCAVIAKALIGLDDRADGDFRIWQAINMRERTIPPQPKHACGNLWLIGSNARRVAASEAKEFGMEELVDLIGGAARKSIADHAEILDPNRDGRDIIINTFENLIKEVRDPCTKIIVFTDWSKFGFYEADFGWGKPVWTSIAPEQPSRSTTVIMSSKEGDGIEAWVHLDQKDMQYFENDEQIKLFAA